MASQSINNCVITHLLTGLPAARSLARIPSEESIVPMSLLLLREDTFTTTEIRIY